MPEATARTKFFCPSCGGEMIQKSRTRLVVVGLGMAATVGIAFVFSWFWAPGIILLFTGVYLLVWASLGRGLWCRQCKKFGTFDNRHAR